MIDPTIPLLEQTLRRLHEKYAERFANYKPAPAKVAGAGASTDKKRKPKPSHGGSTPYGLHALDEECARLANAAPGGRNAALNEATFSIYQLVAGGELDESDAANELRAAAELCGLDEAEITKTMRSASAAGRKQPRSAPESSTRDEVDCPDIPAELLNGKPATNQRPSSSAGLGPHQLRNWRMTTGQDGSQTSTGRALELVARDLFARAGGWPKMVGEHMIVPGRRGESHQWIGSHAKLFAWLQSVFPGNTHEPPVDWSQGGDKSTKEEFYHYLRDVACDRYHTLELYPHYPAIDGVLYLHPPLPEPTGQDLRAFISRFMTASPEDDDLLRAALFTLLWGGPPGKRPGLMFSAPGSEAGVGSGKSTVAQKLAELVGGSLGCSSDSSQLVTRLLSKNAVGARVVLLDNLKSLHFSNMDIEGILTAPTISGRQLYTGDASRPNYLTWMITVNDPSLSKDMAQRFIPIHIRKAQYSSTWDAETDAMIRERRWHILADAIAEMKEKPKPLQVYTRYGQWNGDVLSKLPNPDSLVELIRERQCEVDDDDDKAQMWVGVIERAIREINCDPESDRILFSCLAMFKILEPIAERGKGMNWVLKSLYKMKIPNLKKVHTKHFRGLVWNFDLDIKKEIDYDEKRDRMIHRFIPE